MHYLRPSGYQGKTDRQKIFFLHVSLAPPGTRDHPWREVFFLRRTEATTVELAGGPTAAEVMSPRTWWLDGEAYDAVSCIFS